MDSRGLVYEMRYLKGISGQNPSREFLHVEKRIALHGHLIQDIPVHKQGNLAPMLSPKHEARDVTPEEDIPNGAFSTPHI